MARAMTRQEAEAFLSEMFAKVFTAEGSREDSYRYFSEDYHAVSNGQALDRATFDEHVASLRSNVRSLECEYEDVITVPDRIAAVLTFTVTHHDGTTSRIRSHAFYTLRDHQITELQEVTHLLEGSDADRDIATQTG